MSMDLARLGIEVDSSKVRTGVRDLKDFGDEGKKTERKVGDAADRMSKDFDKLGVSLKSMAKLAGGAFAALIGGLSAGAAIQEARQFGAALSEVSTLIEGNAQQTKFLEQETKRLAATYGGTGTSQAQAFYQAISAGAASVEDAALTLDTANKLAIGGVTDVTTAVGILSTAMNVYGADVLSAEQASDAIFVAVKAGVTTVGELSASLGKVLPLAKEMGLSFDETAAATAALTKGGLSTAEAVTSLRATLSATLGPSKQASDLAKQLGLDFNAAALESKGFAGFMQEVVDKTGGSSEKMQTLFGSVEAVGAALAFSGSAGESMNEILEQMAAKAGMTVEAFTKMSQSLDVRLNIAMGKIWTLTATFGEVLLTVLVPAMEVVGVLAQALAENMDRLGYYFGVAAVGIAVAYTPAIIAAGVATAKFAASILLTRKALVRSGWGVLIVLVGEMIYQLMKAKEQVGSFGKALVLLGEVATGVWEGIVQAAGAIPVGLAAVWEYIKYGFFSMVSELGWKWGEFLVSLGKGLEGIPGFEDTVGQLRDSATAAWEASNDLIVASGEAWSNAGKLTAKAKEMASGGFDKAREAMAKLSAETEKGSTVTKETTETVTDLNDALAGDGADGGKGGSTKDAAKKAGKEIKKLKGETEAFNDALKEAALNTEKMGEEKANILIGGIQSVSDAFGDLVANGFSDFKSFTKSIVDMFKNMLSQMISLALKNKIMISLGLGGVGAGGVAVAGGAAPGGGGMLGNLLGLGGGGGGGLLSGILGSAAAGTGLIGGFSSVVGSLGIGGLGGAASSIGMALSGATTGMVGFATALGAVAVPLLAVAAVFSFFKKKTKELDAGFRITVDGMDALVESFRTIETKRFWGLSKKVRTNYSRMEEEAAEPFERIIGQMQMSVVNASSALGIGAEAFDNFATTVQVSTKGLSEEEANKAVEEALKGFGDEFAAMVPGLEALTKSGEGAYDALQRLYTSLQTVNGVLDTLGGTLYDMSLSGAAAASSLADAFGGLDQLTSATSAYYQNFYSEQERVEITTRQLTDAMTALGQSMPGTRAELRALIEMQDLSTEAGRQMFAALVSLSSQFSAILPAIDSLADKMGALAGTIGDQAIVEINAQITASNNAAAQARQSATEFFRLADSLRSAAAGIGGINSEQDFKGARHAFMKMFSKAISGDVDALGGLASSGQSLVQDGAKYATSALDMKRLEAEVRGKLGQASAVAEALGLGADYQAKLFDVQTAALEHLRDLLSSGSVTQELLQEQILVLGRIKSQIADSANLQIKTATSTTGQTVAALVDNGGRVVASLSAEGARYMAGLSAQTKGLVSAMDANGDGFISATEAQTAATLSTYQSTVMSLVAAVDKNGSMTAAQIRASLAGKASDAQISAVINAVDRNRDGIVTAEEVQAARIMANASQRTASELAALGTQSLKFTNAITGQTTSVTGTQKLTNSELTKVQGLQGQTVSITELVERAVEGNATLTASLLNRLSAGINVSGVGTMVSGITTIGNLLARLIAAQEAALAAQQQEANRQKALASAQAQLESTAKAQQQAISEVQASSAAIYSLANQYGVYLNAQAGAVQHANTAKFGVNGQGLFEAQYGQITVPSGGNAAGFKNQYYASGGLHAQTYGRAGELKEYLANLEAQRKAIRDLGGVPSFATGGTHTGGRARIGENDIEMVAPSRIYNPADTKRMLDNKPVVDAVKEMKEEIHKLREENKQMLVNMSSDTRKMLRLEEKREEIGTPTYTVGAPT